MRLGAGYRPHACGRGKPPAKITHARAVTAAQIGRKGKLCEMVKNEKILLVKN